MSTAETTASADLPGAPERRATRPDLPGRVLHTSREQQQAPTLTQKLVLLRGRLRTDLDRWQQISGRLAPRPDDGYRGKYDASTLEGALDECLFLAGQIEELGAAAERRLG